MANGSEHSKWRDFLRPLVEAAVTALAVYAAGAQHVSSTSFDSRLTAIEVRMDAGDKRMDASDRRSDKFGADIDNFKILLGDIRSDVSFIRGKLESMKGSK